MEYTHGGSMGEGAAGKVRPRGFTGQRLAPRDRSIPALVICKQYKGGVNRGYLGRRGR